MSPNTWWSITILQQIWIYEVVLNSISIDNWSPLSIYDSILYDP